MEAPNLTTTDAQSIVAQAQNIGTAMRGGQKQVFPCDLNGTRYVLKFLLIGDAPIASAAAPLQPNPPGAVATNAVATASAGTTDPADSDDEDFLDEVTSRAMRELAIMREAQSNYLVRPGPIPLTEVTHGGKRLLYFAEEFIEGVDLTSLIRNRTINVSDVYSLGLHITEAIKVLWSFAKVHRDIKPANIMRRNDGSFVLLDFGLALDLTDESLTKSGLVVGTLPYFSPEQLDFALKRQLDFRSDLFSLGIVMYEAATGVHPFWQPGMSQSGLIGNITSLAPPAPDSLINQFPKVLSDIIMRLLNKQPHMRFRNCDLLIRDLVQAQQAANQGGAP
jgi:eukaryotic-like serine/threonine-protein kinase